MALDVSFTAQSVSGEPENILFTDTSTGSNPAVTQRRIYVRDSEGNFVVEDGSSLEYSLWPLPLADTVTLDLLPFDMATSITVQWLDINDAVVYDYTIDAVGFTEYNENFDYQTTQLLASNPALADDNNYWGNKVKLRTFIDSGNQAITNASDIYNAQLCYNEATKIRRASQYLFNGNS